MDPVNSPSLYSIIRTQGRRLELLDEAVRSVLKQSNLAKIYLMFHGSSIEDYERVVSVPSVQTAIGRGVLSSFVLDRAETKRAYPLNEALSKIEKDEATLSDYAFLSFLDDDDIYYSNFFDEMAKKVMNLGSEFDRRHPLIIYGKTNKRSPGGAVVLSDFGYRPRPELLVNNFIPINAFVIKLKPLLESKIRFDEDLDVLEDWDFLLRVLGRNWRFYFVDSVVSEFRIHNNNSLSRYPEKIWKNAERLVRERHAFSQFKFCDEEMLEFFAGVSENRLKLVAEKLSIRMGAKRLINIYIQRVKGKFRFLN